MKIFEHHLRNAASILQLYNGAVPFNAWIKNYFKEHKKFGSKDRKTITHLCYSYFRLGNAFNTIPVEEKVLIGLLLTGTTRNEMLQHLKPEWNNRVEDNIKEKLEFLSGLYNTELQTILNNIFPWQNELSETIDATTFAASHLIQPDLFIRIRPGYEKKIKQMLDTAGITFSMVNQSCFAIPNASKIDDIISLNKEAVVQDYSSQQVASFFELMTFDKTDINVWDCCAASGGKSIMLYDYKKNVQLTVSDIRQSILANLKERFREAGINRYQSFVSDLSSQHLKLPAQKYNLIIADVPCSGSGTWSRTPEQLCFFTKDKIAYYSNLQRNISSNVIKALSQNGYLLYITCSVFKKENEEVMEYLQTQGLSLIKKEVLKGYDIKADSMFATLFKAGSK